MTMHNRNDAALLRLLLIAALVMVFSTTIMAQSKPLTRKESFFGLHFDFHASPDDANIGETLTEAMIDSLLLIVKPDFIQVDCKGHPGIASFPTQVGTPAKSFSSDPLRIFRDVTNRHGVALYVHYSGVKDIEAIRTHPHWARINRDGSADKENTSVHSAYNDSLLIPQLKELIERYHINGAWVDGDCWATGPDYSQAALQKYKAVSGLVPVNNPDSLDLRFMDFGRQSFLDYVQHYTNELHKSDPAFQVASNWAFTSFMPQPVSVNVDFISGDLTPNNSVINAAFEARCIAAQARTGKIPWDIMSWGFSMNWDRGELQSQKSVVQLEQEAAEIIAVGGGFQTYFTQNRDASIRPWQIPVMKGLSKFMRARQPFCRNATPVPQVAILYSGAERRKTSNSLFGNGGLDAIRGITNVFMDAQYSVEVLMEHHLHGNMNRYPLIVIPETVYLEQSFTSELINYVSNGGKLLVIGAKATALIAGAVSMDTGQLATSANRWLGFDGSMAAVYGAYQSLPANSKRLIDGSLYAVQDLRYPAEAVTAIKPYGKGMIGFISMDFGINYNANQSALFRNFIDAAARKLFQPAIDLEGSHLVHVIANTRGGETLVHLINSGGQHANPSIYNYDELPPLRDLKVHVRGPRPSSVHFEPGHQPLQFTWKNGVSTVNIPKLEVHGIVVMK